MKNPTTTTATRKPIACDPIRTPEPPTARPQVYTVPTYAEYLQQVGNAATYIAIRARIRTSADNYLMQLAQQARRDYIRTALTDYARAAADDAMTDHDAAMLDAEAHQQEAANLRRAARRLYISTDERTALTEAADREAAAAAADKAAAAAAMGTAQDIDRRLTLTTSDRQDIAHDAIVAYLDAMQGADWSNPDTRDAAFYAAIAAAGRSITSKAATAGYAQTVSKPHHVASDLRKADRSLTEDAAEQQAAAMLRDWQATYGPQGKQPFTVRGGMSTGWITWDEREAGKRQVRNERGELVPMRPAGVYQIFHYKTHAPRPLNEATDQPTAGGIVTPSDFADVLASCGLSDRQRQAVLLLAVVHGALRINPRSPRAAALRKACARVARAGIAAAAAHQQETDRRMHAADTLAKRKRIARERGKQLDGVRNKAMTRAALLAVGVPAGQLDYESFRLRDKLQRVIDRKPAPLTLRKPSTSPAKPRPVVSPIPCPPAVARYGSAYADGVRVTWHDSGLPCVPVQPAPYVAPQPQPVGLDAEGREKYSKALADALARAARYDALAAQHTAAGRKMQAADLAESAALARADADHARALLALGQ